ncbi:hypothetical protein P152DRAFT_26783 [Eremomyces bilateralis CBS 781.70]|uniref:Uncharacterized protein n=1 Tax=Eremomyces bilateralis CBS 781.70 TaxID=1392243 RepID=A0A6G1G2D7_9PEZI|nr:uncharacterized protein P152DRAFT_26783 [Eremomyces bilateralis CBS 781.70]KAF1812152.1 hypothetical protein P152DRAFT_26783 [Eremomyces bilateralis CBS 781.70]
MLWSHFRRLALLSFFAFVFVSICAIFTKRFENPWAADRHVEVAKPGPLPPVIKAGQIHYQEEKDPSPSKTAQGENGSPPAKSEGTSTQRTLVTAPPRETRRKSKAWSPPTTPLDMDEMLDWNRPGHVDGHYPPYEDYVDYNYDPNRWEGFPEEHGFYQKSGVDLLRAYEARKFHAANHAQGRYANGEVDESHNSSYAPYLPYPDFNGEEWRRQYHGDYVPCRGPRNLNLNESIHDVVHAYRSVPLGFPEPVTGSYEALDLDEDICIDRISRYGPYGLDEGRSVRERASWAEPGKVDWETVSWGELQNECLNRNQERYDPNYRRSPNMSPGVALRQSALRYDQFQAGYDGDDKTKEKRQEPVQETGLTYRPRTALLIRTWEGYNYRENDFQAIRAMIMELSLHSGGEFQVFMFINVKDRGANILHDRAEYSRILRKSIPKEFRSISILWNEEICEKWYPEVGDWQVYWQQFMPLQWFSRTHPEFEFIWNWEVDARYTTNHYHFLQKIGDFSRDQPRKYLWERNSRFYFPGVHGPSFTKYRDDTNALIAESKAASKITTVWGAQPAVIQQMPLGPKPPTTESDDNFTWGVGEEADFITLLPMWEPQMTGWPFRDKLWNFIPGHRPHFSAEDGADDAFTHPDFAAMPRRVYINTITRLSKRLLDAMHEENRAGRSMQAEMWPSSVALHHGFKAVYAPHPIYFSRKWDAQYADAVFNAADADIPGRWAAGMDSVYNKDREHNFEGWSWYYRSMLPRVLFRRWMGWKAADELGEVGGPEWEEGIGGKMCLPGVLLHPVKHDDVRRPDE